MLITCLVTGTNIDLIVALNTRLAKKFCMKDSGAVRLLGWIFLESDKIGRSW